LGVNYPLTFGRVNIDNGCPKHFDDPREVEKTCPEGDLSVIYSEFFVKDYGNCVDDDVWYAGGEI
jgi:hypothetical protein